MKKLFITVFLSVFLLTGVSIAGPLTDGFDAIVTEKTQREDVLSAKSSLIRMQKCVNLELEKLAVLKATGSFDTVPLIIKTFLLKWEDYFEVLKADLDADAEVVEIFTGGGGP